VIALFGVGLFRLFGVVLHRPVLGYGNNFDFYRLAQWFGVSSDRAVAMPPHIEGPIAAYFWGAPRFPDDAYLSSDLLFVTPAVHLARAFASLTSADPGVFDIRWIGAFRSIALLASLAGAALAFHRAHRITPVWLAAAFAFVLADPMCTLFLNTLYCEFSGLVFATGSILCLVLLHTVERPRAVAVGCAGAALVGLGLSKVQNQGLPLVFVAVASAFWLTDLRRRRDLRLALAVLASCALVPLVIQNRRPSPGVNDSIVLANSTDAWFGALLPALPDPASAVAALGLPPRCVNAVGRDYYEQRALPLSCPEIRNVSRLRALPLLAQEPAASMRLLLRAARNTAPWSMRGYGQVEGMTFGRLRDVAPVLAPSTLDVLSALPQNLYCLLLLLAMLGAPMAFTMHLRRRRGAERAPSRGAEMAAALLGAVVAYAFFSSLFGDGFYALHHHFFLGGAALLPSLVAATVAGAVSAGHRQGSHSGRDGGAACF
jgi:hypothetical protein